MDPIDSEAYELALLERDTETLASRWERAVAENAAVYANLSRTMESLNALLEDIRNDRL